MMQPVSTIQPPEVVHNHARHSAILPIETSRAGFEQLCETFEHARHSVLEATPGEYVESLYRLSGKIVQMRIVGRDVVEIYHRAYAPHAISSSVVTPIGQNSTLHTPLHHPALTPALTIDLWDRRVAPLPYPLPPSASSGEQPPGKVRPYEDRPVRFSDESRRWIWEEFEGSASWLDRKAGRMVCSQTLFLRACLDATDGTGAWSAWRASHDLQTALASDRAGLKGLLPLFAHALEQKGAGISSAVVAPGDLSVLRMARYREQ